jgi:hypothetical protein
VEGIITESTTEWTALFPGFLYKIEIYPKLKRTGLYTAVPKYALD